MRGKRIICASKLIQKGDNYHLAWELYRCIHRHPWLLQFKWWRQIEQKAEKYVIGIKSKMGLQGDMTREKYLSGFRFVTELECKVNNRVFFFGPRTIWQVINLDT